MLFWNFWNGKLKTHRLNFRSMWDGEFLQQKGTNITSPKRFCSYLGNFETHTHYSWTFKKYKVESNSKSKLLFTPPKGLKKLVHDGKKINMYPLNEVVLIWRLHLMLKLHVIIERDLINSILFWIIMKLHIVGQIQKFQSKSNESHVTIGMQLYKRVIFIIFKVTWFFNVLRILWKFIMENQHTYAFFDFVMHLLMLRFQNEHSQSSQIILFIF
jgi:hypothetical protein